MLLNPPDALIKIGGSLMNGSESTQELVWLLGEVGEKQKIVLTTGSKDLSNVVREYIVDALGVEIPVDTHIDITMKSRDIVSEAFALTSKKFCSVDSIEWIHWAFQAGVIPVLRQYDLLKQVRPFPLARGLSTDTTSIYFWHLLGAKRLIKLTNVDGIYPENPGQGSPYQSVSTDKLRDQWPTCLDANVPDILDSIRRRLYILNWTNIGNLRTFLEHGSAIGTCVEPTTTEVY